jgi:lysophospholipase L1-like esterase
MATISQAPATLDLVAVKGDDLTVTLTVTENGTAYDWTGATVATSILDSSGTEVATDFTSTTSAGGILTLALTDANSTTLGVATYRWQVNVTKASATRTWLAGALSVMQPGWGGTSTSSASLSITTGAATIAITSITGGAAAGITVADAGGYYAGTNVETVLASIPVASRITQPRHLRRWYTKLATANASRATISVHGDSIVLGGYAGGTTSADWRKSGLATQLRLKFASTYGSTGGGAIKFTSEYDEVTLSGGSTSSTTGPQQQGRSLSAGNTITIAPIESFTGFSLAYWNQGGSFSYAIDGGGATTVTPTGTDVMSVVTVTGLSNTTHSVVIAQVSGTPHVGWFRPTNAVTTGVVVDRFGRSGATALSLAFATTTSANRTRLLDASFNAPGTDLAIIAVGANDIAAQSPTPSDFYTLLKVISDYVSGTVGGCTLLVAGPRYSTDLTYTQAEYYAQMELLANTDDHVAFIDLADLWISYDTVNQSDLDFMYDTIHPNAQGHHSYAQWLAEALVIPQPVV